MPDGARCPKGSYYGAGCRCDFCRKKNADYMRQWRYNRAQRSWGVELPTDQFPAQEVRDLLRNTRRHHGTTLREISLNTGLSMSVIDSIVAKRGSSKRSKTVTRQTRDKILAVYGKDGTNYELKPEGTLVPAPTWIIYGLLAQGWTKSMLAEVLGRHDKQGKWVCRNPDQREMVTVETEKDLHWLADWIGDRPGPSTVNKKRMLARGIFPLIHYTEEGRLIRGSLTAEQLAALDRVQ